VPRRWGSFGSSFALRYSSDLSRYAIGGSDVAPRPNAGPDTTAVDTEPPAAMRPNTAPLASPKQVSSGLRTSTSPPSRKRLPPAGVETI